jgi:hypothetical protein
MSTRYQAACSVHSFATGGTAEAGALLQSDQPQLSAAWLRANVPCHMCFIDGMCLADWRNETHS